ncbi:MAG TPA: transporter [Gemmatimonadales bacterium]
MSGARAAAVALLFVGPIHRLAAQDAEPIQDNSFLIEEAYNQEAGVVQHISTFSRADDGGWLYTFTQEWPLGDPRHQLSYTVPLVHGDGSGLGDVFLNYRLQALGDPQATVAFSPRVSLLLPTGSTRHQRGVGGVGGQFALPVSLQVSPRLSIMLNAGTTYVPRAKDAADNHSATLGWNLGGSGIWFFQPNLNLLLEAVWGSVEEVTGPETTRRHQEAALNPGVRWAFNLSGGLQIVPGAAYSIGIGPSRGDDALFLYLSFEHPFRH